MTHFWRRGLPWALALTLWTVAPLNLTRLPQEAGPVIAAAAQGGKIDERVLADIAATGEADFIIMMAEQADLSGAADLPTRQAKGRYVYERLRETAERTQASLLKQLDTLGVPHRSYYVANLIAAQGDRAVVEALAASPLVARIEADRALTAGLPHPEAVEGAAPLSPSGIEWNVARVNADDVWNLGYTGQGVVVADQDTGFQWDHPAVKGQYLGWNGTTADHNFHWWDAIHSDISGDLDNDCGFSIPAPCDDYGHGTHTLGTAVGDGGVNNQIGVAPGAKWIGCRNMDNGVGRPTTYIECFEFFLAPWDLNGQNADPDMAPDVINNSWGCPDNELCTGTSLLTTVNNVRAAGIVVAVAAGNTGPNCSTITAEPTFFDASTTVGATGTNNEIASFSSRGPATFDGSNRLKPDLSAPGLGDPGIRSSFPTNIYGFSNGTSMATPHVAGAVALLLSAHPEYSGDVTAIEQRLLLTATHLTSAQTCGGVPGTNSPNNTFGWGLLDIYRAVTADLYYMPLVSK